MNPLSKQQEYVIGQYMKELEFARINGLELVFKYTLERMGRVISEEWQNYVEYTDAFTHRPAKIRFLMKQGFPPVEAVLAATLTNVSAGTGAVLK